MSAYGSEYQVGSVFHNRRWIMTTRHCIYITKHTVFSHINNSPNPQQLISEDAFPVKYEGDDDAKPPRKLSELKDFLKPQTLEAWVKQKEEQNTKRKEAKEAKSAVVEPAARERLPECLVVLRKVGSMTFEFIKKTLREKELKKSFVDHQDGKEDAFLRCSTKEDALRAIELFSAEDSPLKCEKCELASGEEEEAWYAEDAKKSAQSQESRGRGGWKKEQ